MGPLVTVCASTGDENSVLAKTAGVAPSARQLNNFQVFFRATWAGVEVTAGAEKRFLREEDIDSIA